MESILLENGYRIEQCLIKLAFYRNYNSDFNDITGESEWSFDALKLI